METLDYRTLREQGGRMLAQSAYPPKKLILWHTVVMLGTGFLLSLISYLLDRQIAGLGGLGGLDQRAKLETAQSILTLAQTFLLPFWAIGLTGTMLRLSRGEDIGPGSLLVGFRRWAPVLRLNILKGLIFFVIFFLAAQVGMTIYMMSPASKALYDLVEQMETSGLADPTTLLTEEVIMGLALKMLPFMLIPALIAAIPVFYRLRMMDYALMDRPRLGARFAMRLSNLVMRRKCWQLFKLDLHFWWFYALEALAVGLCYGDMLLPLVGVSLPGDAALMSFLFYALGLVCQLGLYMWKKDEVLAAYTRAYEALLPPPPPPREPAL